MENYKTLKEIYDDVEGVVCGCVIPEYFSKEQEQIVMEMSNKTNKLDWYKDAKQCWKLLDEAVIEIYRLNK